MEYFVDKSSIVRRIWGSGDTVLFIFAGSAAEFALNKAVDWLYFTGRLPADPLGRLFSTIGYAKRIIFSERDSALKAIDSMRAIHAGVEANRGARIPDWAYRDVLFMLIHYSIAAYELFEKKLTDAEKEDVFDVFYRVGDRMGIPGLPTNYAEWLKMRSEHLQQDLQRSKYTDDLFKQYRKHLGPLRYKVLREGQVLIVPKEVGNMLGLKRYSLMTPIVAAYKMSRWINLDWFLKSLVLPQKYKKQVKALDIV
ncbi:MAG TPA: oxygenase MpaB family protein [Chitinophagaceae bacterium]